MDNILDLIIFLVIVYGFLSPFFKKKKESPEFPEESTTNPEPKERVRQQRHYSQYRQDDVLSEIEGFFRKSEPSESAESRRYPSESQKYEPEALKPENYSGEDNSKKKETEKRVTNAVPALSAVLSSDVAKVKLEPANEAAIRVRAMLKNPETVKDALILSEILRRPRIRYR